MDSYDLGNLWTAMISVMYVQIWSRLSMDSYDLCNLWTAMISVMYVKIWLEKYMDSYDLGFISAFRIWEISMGHFDLGNL